MANEEHLAILRQGVAIWNQWRKDNPGVKPDLISANLRSVNLSSVNLTSAYLISANLRSTNLIGANLTSADLSRADLSGAILNHAILGFVNFSDAILISAELISANLSFANLSSTNLADANLTSADLSRANLRRTDLSEAILSEAILSNVRVGWTVFGNVDLSEVKGLESIIHEGPSIIGIDTIYKSKGNIPYNFLLGAGIPKDDIAYLLSLAGKAIDFYSCFISCSSRDKAFVERLHANLLAKGIRCWVAWEDLKIGEPFLLGIDKGIQLHDKLLLVLSENSVTSGWVQHEVLSALAKEQWKDHDAYQKAFDRLLRDLKMGEIG